MSDDTYYTVLEISEKATQAEIKAAYRNLIKQVHPDTLANLPPYLRGVAEDKAKEITEANSVLSDVTKRRQYDSLLAEHRQRTGPTQHATPSKAAATPPPPSVRCLKCGSQNPSDYSFCIVCGASVKKKDSASSPTSPRAGPGPQAQAGKRGYWEPLKRWPGKHPELVGLVGLVTLMFVVVVFSDSNTPASPSNATVTKANAPAPAISYSAFPCDARYSVSPIDGKPCRKDVFDEVTPSTQTPEFEVVDGPTPLSASSARIAPKAKRPPAPEGEQVASCSGNLNDEPGGVFITGSVKENEPVEVLDQKGNFARIKNKEGQIGWLSCQ